MASESKSFERSQWWDHNSDQEIRGKLILVEGKNRELCVVASERIAELADVADGLARRTFAAEKQIATLKRLLQAEMDRATKQLRERRKQSESGVVVDSEVAYAEGLVDGLKSAICFGGLEGGGGEKKTCEGCFLVNPEQCPRDESQTTTKCILSA